MAQFGHSLGPICSLDNLFLHSVMGGGLLGVGVLGGGLLGGGLFGGEQSARPAMHPENML